MARNTMRRIASVVVLAAISAPRLAHARAEDDVSATFHAFVVAQNKHDRETVTQILLDSPNVLWIARGAVTRTREAVLRGFEENYRGTWAIEPRYDQEEVKLLSPEVAELSVPAMISIAPKDQPAQPKSFFLIQIYVRQAASWKLTTIITVPS